MLGEGAGPNDTPARGGGPDAPGGDEGDDARPGAGDAWPASGGDAAAVAFAAVVEENVQAVFQTAWRVLNERWAAAEIAGEAFVEVWRYHQEVAPDDWVPALHDAARRRARGWLAVNPSAVPQANRYDDEAPLPTLGPTLRARVVASLDAQGVPTAAPGTPGSDGPRHLAGARRGAAGLLAGGLRARVAAGVAAATVVIAGVGIVQIAGGRGSGDELETGPPRPSEPPEVTTPGTVRRAVTTSTTVGTSSTSSTTSTSTTTTTAPSSTTTTSTTTTPPRPSPADTRPTTTTPPGPEPPRVLRFSGDYDFDDDCSPEEELTIRWETEGATSGRIRREGGDWRSLRDPSSGELRVCDQRGTAWVLEVANEAGTDSATFEEDR
jgi:hypothetical protein